MDTESQTSPSEDANTIANDAVNVAQLSNPERWSKLPKTRGRQPRDPNAQSIQFRCRNIDDLEGRLRDYLEAPTAPAEYTTLEFHYPVSAAFMVYAADFRSKEENRTQGKQNERLYGKLDCCAVSVIDALAQTTEPKDQMRRQKAIAKVCVEACEKADGFRYSFHNNWLSREDEACRFSYFCNDSTLNKGRAANEGAGTTGKKMRKPVYDCHGLIAIKFSQTKQSLEIHYKHVPLHKTYAERAPPPRKDSKRYKLLEVFDPESLPPQRSKRRQSEEAETSWRTRRRRTNDPPAGTEDDGAIDLTQEDGLQPLVHFLDSADSHIIGDSSTEHQTGHDDTSTNTAPAGPLANGGQGRETVVQRHARMTKEIPGVITGAFHGGSITWSEDRIPEQTLTQKPKRKSTNSRSKGIVEAASSGVPKSEFEMLKAKLEEAEKRIKKLESEKSQVPQPWPGPGYPFPPPSQYPYPYPSSYPYPPRGYPQAPPYHGPPPPHFGGPTVTQPKIGAKPTFRAIQPSIARPDSNLVPNAQISPNTTLNDQKSPGRPLPQAAPRPDSTATANPTEASTTSSNRSENNDQSQPSESSQNQTERENVIPGEK